MDVRERVSLMGNADRPGHGAPGRQHDRAVAGGGTGRLSDHAQPRAPAPVGASSAAWRSFFKTARIWCWRTGCRSYGRAASRAPAAGAGGRLRSDLVAQLRGGPSRRVDLRAGRHARGGLGGGPPPEGEVSRPADRAGMIYPRPMVLSSTTSGPWSRSRSILEEAQPDSSDVGLGFQAGARDRSPARGSPHTWFLGIGISIGVVGGHVGPRPGLDAAHRPRMGAGPPGAGAAAPGQPLPVARDCRSRHVSCGAWGRGADRAGACRGSS